MNYNMKELIKQSGLTINQLTEQLGVSRFILLKGDTETKQAIHSYIKERDKMLSTVFGKSNISTFKGLSKTEEYILNKIIKYLNYKSINTLNSALFVNECQEHIKEGLGMQKNYRQRIFNTIYNISEKGYLVRIDNKEKVNKYKLNIK